MNRVTLPLNSGINRDVNPLYIDSAKGEVIRRKNCRVTSVDSGRVGINTSIKGMESITPAYPASGTNKVIGYIEDKERDQGIYFLYNSLGNHTIYKVSGITVTDLGVDADVLDFNVNEIIDADILGDYCVFVSDFNPPRKVDITRTSLAGDDSYDIQLAIRPPSSKPPVKLGSDDARVVNKLVGKTFQFAYMYIYDDYTYSVLSPYSDLVVSSAVFSSEDNTYEDSYVGNFVNVTYDVGTDNVRAIRLLARDGNDGSWFIVTEYEKQDESEYEQRTYSFYNDVARQSLVETEALALYSDVPRLARTIKTVQNRIGLGNVLKGYNKADTNPLINYTVEYEEAIVTSTVIQLPNDHQFAGMDSYYVEFDVPNDASLNEGDIISVNFVGSYRGGTSSSNILTDFSFSYSFSYRITADDIISGAQAAVQNQFSSDIVNKGASIVTGYSIWNSVPYPNAFIILQGAIPSGKVQIVFVGCRDDATFTYNEKTLTIASSTQETPPQGVSTHKAGSYRNVGVLFYDEYSRTSGVTNPQSIYVPLNGERDYADVDYKAKISFAINDAAIGVPDWAKYYRFAITESVNFAGVYPFVSGDNGGGNAHLTYVDGHWVIALNMPTNLQYEFAKGDYLLLEQDSGSVITTITKNIIGTRTLIDVGGTEYSGFWLIIPKGDEALSDYESELTTIYREKKEVEDLVYFESSETFDVSSNKMQTLSGDVEGEDAWFVKRKFEWDNGAGGQITSTPTIEDFYINVDDAIRAYSKGRVVVEFDTLGEIRLQDFVWSFNYLDNTKINGISTFNSLNRKQLDEKDGQIQRIKLAGFVIKVVQDNKETSLYIGKEEISNADGSLSLVKSNNFVGTVKPSTDDYGTRFPRSVVRHNRDIYYFDGDRGEVIRSSPNGQFPISSYGMKSEFLRIKRAIESATSSDVFAYYDVRNDEYVITVVIDGDVETWSFKEGADLWNMELELTDSNDIQADFYGNIGEQVLSFGFDKVWRHERTTSYSTFYGDLKQLSITGVLNIQPEEDKVLLALKTDSNRGVDTNITSPITNTRPVGQKSILYTETYREREGSFTSAVFKNILQAGGAENIALIHSGDDMVGKFLEIEFTDFNTDELQIRTLVCTFNIKK